VDEGRIVSMVNYHPTPVVVGKATFNVASIGSVCTDPSYRGRKLASNLLLLAADRMIAENVHVVVISGDGGIYHEFGSALAGNMREVLVPVGTVAGGHVSTIAYGPTLFDSVRALYDGETVRFVRGEDEFRLLIAGQTYPDDFADYPLEVVMKDGAPVAYAVLVIHKENDEIGIKEFAGDRAALLDAVPSLASKYARNMLHFAAAPDDPILSAFPAEEARPIHQHASFKILDFAGLMQRLAPHVADVLGGDAEKLSFGIDGDDAVVSGFGKELRIHDPRDLAKFVFGCAGPGGSKTDGILGDVLSRLFPVPFPWTHGLNYQ
jgi:hypothetical protein